MRTLARIALSIVLLFSFFFLLPPNAHADSEFQLDYNVLYSLQQDGNTQVTQNITLKNQTPNYYADKFQLKIGSTKIENAKAHDVTGDLQTDVNFENNLTTITIKFNQKVIGKDKTESWQLTYTSKDLTSKSGQIWDVSIPRLAKSADIATYNATVSVPLNFGSIAFATPTPKTQTKNSASQDFTFDKDQLTDSGISMSFGEKQVFAFKINYHIQNDNLTPQTKIITLPPDNNYQKVVIQNINPKPNDVITDVEGNFLAQYKLASKQSQDIVAEGYVETTYKPFRNIDNKLSDEDKKNYLLPQQYWEVDNASIHDKAKELKTPHDVYNFVVNYLTYSDARLRDNKLGRLGAVEAINSPKDAVCTEFTDLFITLSRAAGIPAREVEGYAYTQNERLRPLSLAISSGDILHAWPEYWDDNLGWVQIDPTWGSTSGGIDYFHKLDFNHITLIQRGISSTDPQPAGAFKKAADLNKKYIDVSFADSLPNPTTTPDISLDIPAKIYSGIPTKMTITLKNKGSASIIGEKLTVYANNLVISPNASFPINILPPFSQKNFELNLQNKNFFTRTSDSIITSFADTQISQPVEILPVYEVALTINFVVSAGVTVLIIASGLYLYKKTHAKGKKIKQRIL